MMKAFNNAATDLRGGWQPSLSLELALAEVLDAPSQPIGIASPVRTSVRAKPQPAILNEEEQQLQAESEPLHSREKHVEHVVHAGDVIKAWKHMSSKLPKAQANLSALMNSVRMIDVKDNTLILGLASDVLVSKID